MKKAVVVGLVVLLAVSAVFVVGCGNSEEQAKAALSAALDKLEASVGQFQQMSPTSTVADIKAAKEVVAKDWQEVVNAAKGVKEANIETLEKAWADVETAFGSISDDASLIQAAALIMGPVQALIKVESELRALVPKQ